MTVLLNEAAECDEWLETYLSSDSTLMGMVTGVFSTFFGYGKDSLPLVRFALIEQDDLMVVNANRVWSELVYQVEAVTAGRDSRDTVQDIARQLDVLLHRHQGDSTLSSVFIQEVFRRAPIFIRDSASGDEYLRAGGEYVIRVSPVA